jgi:hypothetical protein
VTVNIQPTCVLCDDGIRVKYESKLKTFVCVNEQQCTRRQYQEMIRYLHRGENCNHGQEEASSAQQSTG